RRKAIEVAAKSFQRQTFITISSAAVNVDGVGVRPLGDFGLVFNVGNGMVDDAIVRRIEHHELVRVKTGAYVVLLRKRAAALKPHHDVICLWKLFDAIAGLRVRLDGENLALNAKSADAVRRAELQ